MSMKKILKSFPLFLLTLAIVAVPFLLMNLVFFGGALFTAATGGGFVEGTVTTEQVNEKQPDLNMAEVAEKITKMRPAQTPLNTIFASHAKKKKVGSQRTEYYAVDTKPFKTTVKTAYSNTGDGQDFASVEVNNIDIFDVDDTVMFPDIKGSDDLPFVGSVAAKDNVNGVIKIQPLNGPLGTGSMAEKEIVPQSIPEDSIVVRMGPAKSELDAQHTPYAPMPQKDFNYCQNFMAQVEESIFQRMTNKEVQWDFTDYEEANLYDMKARMELSYIWGVRKQFYDKVDNEMKYTCNGVVRYMEKTLNYTYADGLKLSNWIDWTKQIFEDNSGSDTRFLFAGDELLAAISNIEGVTKQLDASKVDVKWGINFSVVETKFGMLYIHRHPLLGLIGMGKDGLVLDVNNLEEHEFMSFNFTTLELKKSGQRNADATVIQKVSCPVLKYPATHALIKGV